MQEEHVNKKNFPLAVLKSKTLNRHSCSLDNSSIHNQQPLAMGNYHSQLTEARISSNMVTGTSHLIIIMFKPIRECDINGNHIVINQKISNQRIYRCISFPSSYFHHDQNRCPLVDGSPRSSSLLLFWPLPSELAGFFGTIRHLLPPHPINTRPH